jgi:hypothetical protein
MNTTTKFTYYNGHRVIIYPTYEPLGPACTCSMCGHAISGESKYAPVRVVHAHEIGEMRFHGHCYKVILREPELITSPSDGAQTSTT